MHSVFESFKEDPDKSFILNYAPIFAELKASQKDLIAQKSKVIHYNKGDIVYRQHDSPDAFYCLISGRVKIFTAEAGREQALEYLTCGKYFGIISLLTSEPHSVTAQAINDSKILKIAKEDFQMLLSKIPKLAIDLSQTLSRRLRKKDLSEKKIFESSIISVFGAVRGIGRTTYAANLALSLRKETNKDIILVDVSKSANEVCLALGLDTRLENFPIIKLDTPFPIDSFIKAALLKEPASGISILNISHDNASTADARNLNALLTQLTNDYHYVIVDLPTAMDEVIFEALKQSDIINIITDYNVDNLTQTKALILELFEKVNYPQEKIKVIINERKESKSLAYAQVFKLLDYNIYATLPVFWEIDRLDSLTGKVVWDEPAGEYAQAIRRIARELGDVRVGLALSGGAAFGLAHIGVIKVLEKEGIPIDMVAGASMGAFVGALWASGLNSSEIEKIVLQYNNKKVFRALIDLCFPKLAFAKGRKIRALLEKHIGRKTFQDIKFPFKVVACNLNRREEVIYDSGVLVDAVMASIAIPGVFAPARVNGDLIVDGGIIEPVPVGTLVRSGIKKIIAVNVLPSPGNIVQSYELKHRHMEEEKREAQAKGLLSRIAYNLGLRLQKMVSPNILDIIVNSFQTTEYVMSQTDCQKADIVIRPMVVGIDWFDFFKPEPLIKKGEEEANKSLAAIKNLVNE